jgi:hypothetical protein
MPHHHHTSTQSTHLTSTWLKANLALKTSVHLGRFPYSDERYHLLIAIWEPKS